MNTFINILKKSFKTIGTLLLVVSANVLSLNTAQALEPKQKLSVTKIIESFKQNNRVALSRMVSYPLTRQSPLAPINNPNEFLRRYDEVFDQRLLSTITLSNINTDWDSIGWRGVILDNGIIAIDPEGNITEVNYLSPLEHALINKSKSVNVNVVRNAPKGRRALHRSVTNYKQAVVEITTPRFHIRVDDVGQGKLRYASWPINQNTSNKPDLVLGNGRLLQTGGRNQRYVFENGTYSYQLSIDFASSSVKPTGSLEVFKGGQYWIREEVTQVIRR